MKSTSKISLVAFAIVAVLAIFSTACGPAYVGQQQGYVEPIYQPGLSVVIVGGQSGYYDSYHHFYPTIVLNGASGYYNSSHVFVSSSPAVRDAVVSKKPFYAGAAGSQAAAQTRSNTSDPNGIGGGMGRGGTPATAAKPGQAPPITGKPSYATPVAAAPVRPSSGMSRGGSPSPSSFSAPARSTPSSSGFGKRR